MKNLLIKLLGGYSYKELIQLQISLGEISLSYSKLAEDSKTLYYDGKSDGIDKACIVLYKLISK